MANTLQQYVKLQATLVQEKKDLENRLADIDKALAVAKRLDTGTVWINQNLQSTPVTPLGGHKQSGFGVENGMAGLMEFTQPKAIYIPKKATK